MEVVNRATAAVRTSIADGPQLGRQLAQVPATSSVVWRAAKP
jgi:hypothetical protein